MVDGFMVNKTERGMRVPTKDADHYLSDIAGVGCQAIEGNPLKEAEISMFEAFKREGWTHKRRLAHILGLATDGG